MKRAFTQTATKTITLTREIVVQFPYEIHPDSIESESVDATLARADVEWEVEDEDFELDGSEWADVDEETDADVFYE